MATWSNGQAIREYQDFLSTGKQELDIARDGPSIIVSPSSTHKQQQPPIARAILEMGRSNDNDDVHLTPFQSSLPDQLGDSESYPIYICLPPSQLHTFLSKCTNNDNHQVEGWKERRSDFIFCSGGHSNGVIEPILKEFGMCRDSMTQVLVSGFLPQRRSRGDDNDNGVNKAFEDWSIKIGIDSNGEDKWAGESAVCGKWNGAVAERLERNGVRCKTCFYREWRRLMWERAIYDAVFDLVGAVRDIRTTQSDVALYYDTEVSDMVWELTSFLRGSLAVTLSYGFEDRMFSFAEGRGGDVVCELDDGDMFEFLYGVFLMSGGAVGRLNKMMDYLWYGKEEMGLLEGVDLPEKVKEGGMEKPSIMRQGNLRADGVL